MNLKILLLNIRSINKNFEQLIFYLSINKAYNDVIIMSEAWIRSSFDVIQHNIDGFNKFWHTSAYNRASGVVVFVANHLKTIQLDSNLSRINFDSLHLEITIDKLKLDIFALYKSPTLSYKDSFGGFEESLQTINSKNCIICGDINLDTLEMTPETCGYVSYK